MEVRFDNEPASWLEQLLAALRPLCEALGPKSMFVCSPTGRASRARRFKWSLVEDLAAQPATGTLSLGDSDALSLGDSDAASGGTERLRMSVYLRHNREIELRYQPPASIWSAIVDETGGEHLAPACSRFLEEAAAAPGVLHGGISAFDNLAQATSEITGTGTDIEKQSASFVRRRDHDWRYPLDAWTVARRLYWTTLLGPTLAAAAGGPEAARRAGALDVREINGSLMFRAMEGPPRDSLDPEFLAATTQLRRWLWTHTFQNPLDAAGFESEVGLPPHAPEGE